MKDHYGEYSIDPNEKVNIYPFAHRSDVLRPTACLYEPEIHQFVYVVPSRLDDNDHLLFIKHYRGDDTKKSLVYCTSMAVSNATVLLDRLKHMKTLAGAATAQTVQVLELLSTTHFRVLDVSKPIEDFQLCTGAVLIIQARYGEMAMNVPRTGLAFGPRGRHIIFPIVGFQHLLPKALFEQAMHGECTDVIISSFHESPHTFQFTVHKNVMSVIPYFKSAFTVGMRESTNMDVVKLELPMEVDKFVFREFLFYVYLREDTRIAMLPLGVLLPLLKLADYYGFEELLQSIGKSLERQYYSLTGEMALQLLSTIQLLQFEKKPLEEMVLKYIAFNFREVGKLRTFRELVDDEMYEKVIDYIAQVIQET